MTGPAPLGSQATLPPIDRQLHVLIDRATLPGDPGAADLAVAALRRAIERQAPGRP